MLSFSRSRSPAGCCGLLDSGYSGDSTPAKASWLLVFSRDSSGCISYKMAIEVEQEPSDVVLPKAIAHPGYDFPGCCLHSSTARA